MIARDSYGNDRAARTVFALTARRVARPGAVWGLIFGATTAATMATYESSFPTAGSRAVLARSIEGNAAFEAVFGVIRGMDTVEGYTAYKSLMTLMILAALWGLLISTRVLRGEEETGRWELLLGGLTTRGRAVGQVGLGLVVGLFALWIPTAALTVAAGNSSAVRIGVVASLYFTTAVVATAAMFMAVGVLISQLAPTRHGANLIGAGVIATAYLVRMAADSDPRVGWLRWASPFGWIEELRPLTGSRWIAFVPIAAFTAALVVLGAILALRRDAGAGAIPLRDVKASHLTLLGNHAGLTVRLTRPVIVAWLAAFAATGLVFGLVTQAAGRSLEGSPTLERVIARVGATSAGSVTYLGFVFVIAAGLVAVAVAGQISGMRNEEATGRLDNLLTAPVDRRHWLATRLGVGLGLILLAGALTGVTAWIGAASQHATVGFGDLLLAGLNVTPPAVFVLGVGALAYGIWPRAAVGVTYGLVVWSFLIETFAFFTTFARWLRDTSPFLHIAPAPAADPNWTAAFWLVALGVVGGVLGIVSFSRRDLVGA